jgi:DNA polymerase elongation subunit (family B)
VDKFQNWYVCDDKDRAASPEYKNWDGRSVKLGYGRQFNKFSILYFLDSLSAKDKADLTAYNMPKTYFVDIETEIVDGFPKAEEAKSRILSFSIITPDRKAIVLGLEDMAPDKIQKIQDDTNEYFKDFDMDWEFRYHKFKSEYDMVYTFLMKFLPKFPMMTGWNFINYDWQYIVNRCKRLQIDIKEIGMTGSIDTTDSRPLHIGILDYMQLYDKYDRSVKVKESNSLDYVSSQVLNVNKIKFTGSLQDLYRDNFVKYIYYNVVDSVLVYYIDQKLKSMEVLLTLANITNMPLYKASSPGQLLKLLWPENLQSRE